MDSLEKEVIINEKLQNVNLSTEERTELATKLYLLRSKRERSGRYFILLIITLMILGFIKFLTNS